MFKVNNKTSERRKGLTCACQGVRNVRFSENFACLFS